MKTVLFLVSVLFTASSFAQTNSIKLNKGQTITVTSSTSQNMEMGMGMSMTVNSNSTHLIKVNEDAGENFKVDATLTKIKTSSSAMGQESSYDSENPAGSDSELAGVFEKSLDVTEACLLDKKTGIAKSAAPKEAATDDTEEDDLIKGMMGAASSNDNSGIVSGAFFASAAGKKVGDTWLDSSTVNGFKNVSNYSVASINGDMMIINLEGSISGKQQVETQGMQIDITMNTKNKGTIEMNKKSLQVLKRIVNADINANMDMMGQAMDMTGTVKTVTEYK